MTTDWSPLLHELDLWRAKGLTLPLWWRDDDAIAPTPQLDQLAALSQRVGLPVHLAIIPAHATQALADYLQDAPHLIPVVHGWAHQSHSPAGEKNAEFGVHRPVTARAEETKAALNKLRGMFPTLRPLFVPPWNRIGDDLSPSLADQGYRALSTFTPRKTALATPGLDQINTHLDPINWRGDRSLVPPETLVSQIVTQLTDRRIGHADNTEPYGLLTHHLVHDPAIWAFTEDLIQTLMRGPVRPWIAPKGDT